MTTPTTSAADELRRLMTERLAADGTLHDPAWRDAFASVPREVFVPEFTLRARGGKVRYTPADPSWIAAVYQDASLVTQANDAGTATSSSTAPTVMARMLEALDVEDGNRVLEVGTGTGYNAALLSHRLGGNRVTSVDVDPALVDAARDRLRIAGYAPTLAAGNGMAGYPDHAPYDRLVATCGVGRVPDAWRTQVRPHGVMVVAVGYGIARLAIGEDHSACGRFLPHLTAFMAARSTPDATTAAGRHVAGTLATAQGDRQAIVVPVGLDAEAPQFLASLVHPDVAQISLTNEEGKAVRCLYTPDMTSWARITMRDPREAELIHGGPRDLWAERAPYLRAWVTAGRPGIHRYGLTVTAEGGHTLWLDDPAGHAWPLM
ncbi:putative O-methyltransferase [Actinacidiphila reveromycinica]|uniref:Protein-L-isoaspartate O-methyltransferase n=1 Tax=Actinacidiphila reveromycinica TaxID=659352 RepID=A0A7U3UXG9_9ACTN|nr:methyltransferase domain-containing protein [Streptomyces sp. SN-593]BBB00556.1 putative O-methyltransferase [Streptomyces sp. SN-593]BBB00609.1 putative O-methyltransferase [Streptomyces sp. SN-593]